MSPCWKISKKFLLFDLESYFDEVKHWDFKTISFSCTALKIITVKYKNVFFLMPIGRHVAMEHPHLTNMLLHMETKPIDGLQALRIFKDQ